MEHRIEPLIDFTVPGYPQPLVRHRSGQGNHFDPPENVAAKEKVQLFARWRGDPVTVPVIVLIACEYRRPNPTADVDNLAKLILDALNGYVYRDDRQVMTLVISKIGGRTDDRTRVTIYQWTDP